MWLIILKSTTAVANTINRATIGCIIPGTFDASTIENLSFFYLFILNRLKYVTFQFNINSFNNLNPMISYKCLRTHLLKFNLLIYNFFIRKVFIIVFTIKTVIKGKTVGGCNMSEKMITFCAKDLVDMLILKKNRSFMTKYGLSRDELIKIRLGLKRGNWNIGDFNKIIKHEAIVETPQIGESI